MALMSYLQKLILVSARQNVSPSIITIQFHLETGHTKMIPFEIYLEFKISK